MDILDETKPRDIDLASVLGAFDRETRAKLNDLIVSHDGTIATLNSLIVSYNNIILILDGIIASYNVILDDSLAYSVAMGMGEF